VHDSEWIDFHGAGSSFLQSASADLAEREERCRQDETEVLGIIAPRA
jgi:hypothetical protein